MRLAQVGPVVALMQSVNESRRRLANRRIGSASGRCTRGEEMDPRIGCLYHNLRGRFLHVPPLIPITHIEGVNIARCLCSKDNAASRPTTSALVNSLTRRPP
jgi:hypothetical protein